MTAVLVEKDEATLRAFYRLFGEGDLANLIAYFAGNASYTQCDSRQTAVGQGAISLLVQTVIGGFRRMSIAELRIKPAEHLADQHLTAASCYGIEFVVLGGQLRVVPGFSGSAARAVVVRFGETVWVDAAGLIVHIDSTRSVTLR